MVAGGSQREISIHFLAHNMVDLVQMARGIGLGVWAAIDQFQTAAMPLEREPAG
jgi:hypothetical protein